MCHCFKKRNISKLFLHFYIITHKSTYEMNKVLMLELFILMLSYSYTFHALIYLGGIHL